ncbi:DUF3313 domain-containing protein [Kosakonia oryzendophytica]|uniref:DUF3313 domain-containing protein n=1 Tax=Kosakonia oryzendophytica TaxID=1005665 RepID=UPI003D327740
MKTISRGIPPTLLLLTVFLAGCSGSDPVRYAGLQSTTQLQPNTGDNASRIPYRYSKPVDWQKYHSVIIEPVSLYNGSDSQFDDMSSSDKQALASYMQQKFRETLQPRLRVESTPAADTLRLKLTLTGAGTTPQVVGTVTKFDLAGGPYNIVQSIRGGQGMMSGYVNYAVEVYDATSNQLLLAYVAKQYPNAMNVSATIGSLSAAEVGIDKGAEELAEMLK